MNTRSHSMRMSVPGARRDAARRGVAVDGAAHIRQPVADGRQRDLAEGQRRRRPDASTSRSTYTNANKKGPALVVIPGEIKSNNATFLQKFTANNIADFGEIELSSANFQVLERSNLGPIAARNSSSPTTSAIPTQARKFLKMGKLKTHQVRREVRHPEDRAGRRGAAGLRRPHARADGGPAGRVRGSRGGARPARSAAPASARCTRAKSTSVWVIGMRYKIINAETTEQVATGYTEEKMEIGAKSSRRARRVRSRSRAACRSTRWCSGWCRSRCGKSTTSTSDAADARPSRRRPAAGVAVSGGRDECQTSDHTRQVRDPARDRTRRDGRRLRRLRPDDQARRRA